MTAAPETRRTIYTHNSNTYKVIRMPSIRPRQQLWRHLLREPFGCFFKLFHSNRYMLRFWKKLFQIKVQLSSRQPQAQRRHHRGVCVCVCVCVCVVRGGGWTDNATNGKMDLPKVVERLEVAFTHHTHRSTPHRPTHTHSHNDHAIGHSACSRRLLGCKCDLFLWSLGTRLGDRLRLAQCGGFLHLERACAPCAVWMAPRVCFRRWNALVCRIVCGAPSCAASVLTERPNRTNDRLSCSASRTTLAWWAT